MQADQAVGRFAFVEDRNYPDYVQVAFFEALPGIMDVAEVIRAAAKAYYPGYPKLLAGLNAHLNYGVGFLLNKYDETPVIDLPYTQDYYPSYFGNWHERKLVTFRFQMPEFYSWGERTKCSADLQGVTVRTLDMAHFERYIDIYTKLNNACFVNHPYWSDRMAEEDIELFQTLLPLLKAENLLFAEYNHQPVGYLFWLPDFNEPGAQPLCQISPQQQYEGYRLDEIAILPAYRGAATLALFIAMLEYVKKLGCLFGEGGIIFEENQNSIVMTRRNYQRVFGCDTVPYRQMAVYECQL
jgi:hypothetical protein